MNDFTQLDAWKEGHKLVLMVYTLVRKFPKEELFALSDQLRRAAVSITSNIAEGFGRQSVKEKIQFYSIASGSITEVQNQLFVARDTQLASESTVGPCLEQAKKVYLITNGLVRSTRLRLVSLRAPSSELRTS